MKLTWMNVKFLNPILTMIFGMLSSSVFASTSSSDSPIQMDFTGSWLGIVCLILFVIAFVLVIFEEQLHLAKSKPVLLASGLIWVLIAWTGVHNPNTKELIETSLRHNFLEYSELFFFLLVSMTYLNAMLERGIFDALRDWLIQKGLSYKNIFWLTGFLAFFISSIANNLTTAMVMCAVVLAVAKDQPKFICLTCINTVIAVNAGGAFSPFGDITTLMVWQKGVVPFMDFFLLFLPALANFVIPAFIMQFAIQKGKPAQVQGEKSFVKPGGLVIVFLFLITIVTAVVFTNSLGLPPVFGMMMGLAYLKIFAYYLMIKSHRWERVHDNPPNAKENPYEFDIFAKIANAEWDTLIFFYGIMLAVGGLGYLGYLNLASHLMYDGLGPISANILVGLLSAVVDNIPVMFAVLTMNPDMSEFNWLLVTMTAGVGGSLLSVGSAAGVALMGQARGSYNFMKHLKWSPVIALGYFGSIGVHYLING